MRRTAPLLIAPECSASGCHHNGDQYLMIKCRSCDRWFCEEHFEAAEGSESASESESESDNGSENRSQRITNVPTVKLVKTGLDNLAFYVGSCTACRAKQRQQSTRRPVDSSWLR
jgi:hypothetical protein